MKNPSVSVVMPLYNKALCVAQAVRSVLSQSVRDFEMIVVNDGSTDSGPEIVRRIRDSRIRLIDQPNSGVSAARNRGIGEAASDLIAFLDADDIWYPFFLATVLGLRAKYPECEVFATNYLYREPDGRCRIPVIRGVSSPKGVLKDYFAVAAVSDPPLWTSAVVAEKSALDAVGGFSQGVTSGEDLLTWARLAAGYRIAYSAEPAAVFRLRNRTLGIPERLPDRNDTVGDGLKELSAKMPDCVSLKKYIALWHRMRASQYLRAGCRADTLKELLEIRQFVGPDIRFYIYLLMALMPAAISARLYSGFCLAKIARRRLHTDKTPCMTDSKIA
ncbi:glycosyltransferase family 2 protein [Desulfonema ishimotonii]|uniref:Glycosyltransferase family 2 protein n=1 Tax=Desulfonema ishimotonii TaxID=45657 RepID=A0A401FZ07_9BACT|nr:glycosyltransferase family A protein [Desulfonema ishimotonii]GBC62209.1 glycosyltransferase family 2 protein [Desulfonema ishimotonii]